jgi:hypothetical protein
MRSVSFLQVGRHFHVSGSITVTKTTPTVESAGGTFRIRHVSPPFGGERVPARKIGLLPDAALRCVA